MLQLIMLRDIKHKGLKKYFLTGNHSGLKKDHVKKIRLVLAKLNTSVDIQDMYYPGSNLHKLRGNKKDQWAVTISGNWRIIFKFKDNEFYDVDYIDYH